MTNYISTTTAGAPTAGLFLRGDTVLDVNGVTWECTNSGVAAVAGAIVTGRAVFVDRSSAQNLGLKSGATVTAIEYGTDFVKKTALTITALPLTISNASSATQASGLKIYDFPEGRLLILGVIATIAETTTSILASTLNASSTCKFSLGSTIGTNSTLATTEVDFCPSTSVTSSATIAVAGAAASAALAASAQFDGTATAKDLYLNFAVPTDADLDADATVTLTGSVIVTWVFLGDY